jgi:hypothetical protein
MKRFKLIFAAVAVMLCMLAPALPVHAANDVLGEACKAKGAASSAACSGKSTTNPLTGTDGILVKVARIMSFLAGASAVILILVSGLMYVMSNGDSSRINSARTTLVYAVVGLIIVGVAQGIVILVLNFL